MRGLLFLTLIAIGLVFTACPYESKVAITPTEKALKIDSHLKGEWVAFHDDGGREELNLTKINKTVIEVYHKKFTAKNKLTSHQKFRVYTTEINGSIFLNIKDKKGNYYFSRYGWTSKNEFYLEAVNKEFMLNNFKPDSVNTSTLRFFLSENMTNEKLFDEELEFYKKYSPEYEKVRMYMRKSGF